MESLHRGGVRSSSKHASTNADTAAAAKDRNNTGAKDSRRRDRERYEVLMQKIMDGNATPQENDEMEQLSMRMDGGTAESTNGGNATYEGGDHHASPAFSEQRSGERNNSSPRRNNNYVERRKLHLEPADDYYQNSGQPSPGGGSSRSTGRWTQRGQQQQQQPPQQQQQQQQQQEVPTCLPGMLGRVLLLPSVSYHLVLICLDNKHSVCLCTQYYQYGQDQQQPYSLKNRLISGNRNMEEEDEAEIAHQVGARAVHVVVRNTDSNSSSLAHMHRPHMGARA